MGPRKAKKGAENCDNDHDPNPEIILKRLDKNNENFNKQLEELTKSVNFISNSFEELREELKILKAENNVIKKENGTIKEKNRLLQNDICNITTEFGHISNEQTKNMIEIKNVPTSANVTLEDVFNTLSVPYNISKIQEANEVIIKDKNNLNKPTTKTMIIKLQDGSDKIELIKKAKERQLNQSMFDASMNGSIFINDYLTRTQKKILWTAKQAKIKKNWAYVWVKYGRILAKKTQTSIPIVITNLWCVEKIV